MAMLGYGTAPAGGESSEEMVRVLTGYLSNLATSA